MIPASVREAQRQRKAMRRYLAARKRAQQAFNVEHAHRHVEQAQRPGSDWIRVAGWDLAKVWDGSAHYETAAGWGH